MSPFRTRGIVLLFAALAAPGQTPPAFDAASIKPTVAEPGSSSGVGTEKGRLTARNVTLKRCLRSAYGVPEAQIFGGPKWVEEDRYDIDAKASGPAGDHDLNLMLRALLAERFQLVFHRETRPLPGYALLVARNGLKAKRATPDASSRSSSTRKSIDAESCTLGQLAQTLSEVLHLPVTDATAIEGAFDFRLDWTPEDLQAQAAGVAANPGITIFAAIQEQLGLKLEARKVPTEVLVIDRAEKPAAN